MINIKYFARLSENLNIREEQLDYGEHSLSVEAVLQTLIARGEPWSTEFGADNQVLVAVNHEMGDRSAELKSGDEVAFFPPVTGG